MSQEIQAFYEKIPYLVVFSVLLVLEYWVLMTHAASLLGSGDYGPLIGIPLLVSLTLIVLICFGFYSITKNTEAYKKAFTITLILFIVQMILIFVEYVVIATDL